MRDTLTIFVGKNGLIPRGKMAMLLGTILVGVFDLDDPVSVKGVDFDGVAVNPNDLEKFRTICTAKTVFH